QILHDWDDERAAAILTNCRRSIADDGRLLVHDAVVPSGPEPHYRKLFDLHMLVLLGGKERTSNEWQTLFAGTGFKISNIRAAGPSNLIEAQATGPRHPRVSCASRGSANSVLATSVVRPPPVSSTMSTGLVASPAPRAGPAAPASLAHVRTRGGRRTEDQRPFGMPAYPRCGALLRNGQPCGRTVVAGSEFCSHHTKLLGTVDAESLRQGRIPKKRGLKASALPVLTQP